MEAKRVGGGPVRDRAAERKKNGCGPVRDQRCSRSFVMLCSCLHALGCLAATVCMFVLVPRASSDSSLIVARLAQAQTVRAVSEQ